MCSAVGAFCGVWDMAVEETSVDVDFVFEDRGYLALLTARSKVVAGHLSISPTSWIWKELSLASPVLSRALALTGTVRF